MLLAVLSGFALALIAPALHRFTRDLTGWLLALLPAALFGLILAQLSAIGAGQYPAESHPWVPALNVALAFYLDGLSALMALLITGIGALIFIYAGGYMRGDPYQGRFYAFLLIFMASMLGVVLADNLLTLFIFWELTGLSSYLLIGFKHTYADSRLAAQKALIVTGGGGLALLAGLVLLGIETGEWTLSGLAGQGDVIRASGLYLPMLLLVCAGAFTKSAQFPFHFWLPGAMAAPSPVSAYLHSATMVKAGVYLLARLSPALSGTDEWRLLLTAGGAVTLLLGAYLSVQMTDLKRILAYSTISSLGMLVMLLGWDSKLAIEAALLFLLVHSLYKGALFMIAGAIDHATGTRDVGALGGLGRVMPALALAGLLAAMSMSGIPILLGFVGKELIYEATLNFHTGEVFAPAPINLLLSAIAVVANGFAVAVALLVTINPFTGAQKPTAHAPHAPGVALWLGPLVLGVMALLLGAVALDPLGALLIGPAATAAYGSPVTLRLALWHGFTPMLILSLITLAIGAALFVLRGRVNPLLGLLDPGARIGPQVLYERAVAELPHAAARFTGLFQTGHLRHYVRAIAAAAAGLVGLTLVLNIGLPLAAQYNPVGVFEIVLAVAILAGTIQVLRAESLLVAIASTGVVGYAVALIFGINGAPDLAMTQFAIETLTVVLFVLVLYRLPDMAMLSTPSTRLRDALVAAAGGLMMAGLMLLVTARPFDQPLTEFFAATSYLEAQGRNVVNVILVDYRGFDTMGEITVLSVAGLGVYALLRLRLNGRRSDEGEESNEQ